MLSDKGIPKYIESIQKMYSNLVPKGIFEMAERQQKLIESISSTLDFVKDITSPIDNLLNSGFFKWAEEISQLSVRLENNPELQFIIITDLERLNIETSNNFREVLTTDIPDLDIEQKEDVLNSNLIPYLKRLEIDSLWLGAEYALKTDIQDNPDKLRHSLVSVRTILEYLIDRKLAPNSLLATVPLFEKEFRNYHAGKTDLNKISIPRKDKIKYFTSRIELGVLDEFTLKDIDFICGCYSTLCDLHEPFISLTENQVRCLKLKTGITIWLLAYLNEIIENG